MMIAAFIAFLSGVTRTIARTANAKLSERIGLFESTWYNYVFGLLCSVVALFLTPHSLLVSSLPTVQLPIWATFGGVIGVVFIILSNFTTPKMAVFSMTLLIFVGQIATGILIDTIAHQQFSVGKVVGGILILVGLLEHLSINRDREQKHA